MKQTSNKNRKTNIKTKEKLFVLNTSFDELVKMSVAGNPKPKEKKKK